MSCAASLYTELVKSHTLDAMIVAHDPSVEAVAATTPRQETKQCGCKATVKQSVSSSLSLARRGTQLPPGHLLFLIDAQSSRHDSSRALEDATNSVEGETHQQLRLAAQATDPRLDD